MVLYDFVVNYFFVLQDEAWGFYWNNAQATIHSFVIYFKKSDAPKYTAWESSNDMTLFYSWFLSVRIF
jgi:hypothetical protein